MTCPCEKWLTCQNVRAKPYLCTSMKKQIYLTGMCVFVMACSKENKVENKFGDYLTRIPEIQLPFAANSHEELSSKVNITDSLYHDFLVDAQGILGKININDSITGVVYLYGGNEIYPELKTYNSTGQLISEQQLLTLMSGGDIASSNGSSYMSLSKDFRITITDTIQSFETDSLGMMIDSTKQIEVVNYKYDIKPNGKIIEIK